MPWIFSFDAEITPHRMIEVLGHAPFCALPAILERYHLVYKGYSRKWAGALATLERKKDNAVHGSAMFLSLDDINKLANFNQSHKQITIRVRIPITSDIVEAIAFVLADESLIAGEPGKDYLKAMVKHLSFFWSDGKNKLKIEDLYKPGVKKEKEIKIEVSDKKKEQVSEKKGE